MKCLRTFSNTTDAPEEHDECCFLHGPDTRADDELDEASSLAGVDPACVCVCARDVSDE